MLRTVHRYRLVSSGLSDANNRGDFADRWAMLGKLEPISVVATNHFPISAHHRNVFSPSLDLCSPGPAALRVLELGCRLCRRLDTSRSRPFSGHLPTQCLFPRVYRRPSRPLVRRFRSNGSPKPLVSPGP